jgi:hypothetical protein
MRFYEQDYTQSQFLLENMNQATFHGKFMHNDETQSYAEHVSKAAGQKL